MSVIERDKKYNFLNRENRVIYDKRRLEAISISEVVCEHPEWIKAKQESVGKSEERIQNLIQRRMVADLYDRMIENDHGNSDRGFNFRVAKWIIENIPDELMPNINEWIENRPLSNIKIQGVSVKNIMTQFGPERPISFLEAVECIIYWKQTNYAHERFCRLFFLNR